MDLLYAKHWEKGKGRVGLEGEMELEKFGKRCSCVNTYSNIVITRPKHAQTEVITQTDMEGMSERGLELKTDSKKVFRKAS